MQLTHTHRHTLLQREAYPVVGQLKSQLNEGVWADSALFDLPFAKFFKGENVDVHVVSQGLGHGQGAGDLLLTLRRTHASRSDQQGGAFNRCTVLLKERAMLLHRYK